MSSTTICVTDTSVIPFPTFDSTCTQASNTTAGTRSVPPLAFSDTSISDSNTSDSADYPLLSRSATFVRYDSGSSSSSSTPSDEIRPTIIPRSKRVASQHSAVNSSRDIFNPAAPAPTPIRSRAGFSFTSLESKKETPLRDPSDEEDSLRPFPLLTQPPLCKVGKLRLEGSSDKHVRHSSDSALTRTSAVATPSANQPPLTIRKKSGQPVKSSLKSARRPELHVVTNGSFAKSEPATPTQTKAVHFDSKLEHVKLFLAEQKPLAVSRDGSPTSDTSGDEFPSFIYGGANRDSSCKHVKILVPNMPSLPRNEENVALQGLVLSQDQRTITGNVRVRNIAYEKRLAVRFTLDWWQTTSEVTARYDKSVEDGAFDVFTFIIRLHDIWSRIEDKTIFIALRYTVAGQEYWDNNAGKNYHVKFVLAPTLEPSSAVDNDASLKDLDSRLEGLAKTRSSPIPTTPYRLGRSFSADHQYSSFAKSLSNFASAYKTQPKSTSSSSGHHTRTHTHPSGVSATAGLTAAPLSKTSKAEENGVASAPPPRTPPGLSPGSPREVMGGTPSLPARSEMKPTSPESPSPSLDSRERNHRRSFIDRAVHGSPNLRRTPPGSPLKFDVTGKDAAVQLPRTGSYPLIAEKLVRSGSSSIPKLPLSIQTAQVGDGGSEESTPYDVLQSSSSSNSSCTPLPSPGVDLPRSDTSYKQFLDQFCFYTGTDSLLQESSESVTLPRSQSASRIEHYTLSHSPPPSFSSHTHMRDLPARFPFDNSTTPTAVRV